MASALTSGEEFAQSSGDPGSRRSRSALFLPYPNLGVIILDEEHEPRTNRSAPRAIMPGLSPSKWVAFRVRRSSWVALRQP